MLRAILLLAGLILQQDTSGFNSYEVHLDPVAMEGRCATDRFPDFRNHTYQFRSDAPFFGPGSSVTLHRGVHTEHADGFATWSASLDGRRRIRLGGERAMMLLIFVNHLLGSGSKTHLFIVRCRAERLETVFEAAGEGIYPQDGRGYSYSDSGELRVTHAVWRAEDCHACASRQIDELYRWDVAADRFRLAKRSEGAVKP